MTSVPRVLRAVPADARQTSRVGHYLTWLQRNRDLAFGDYDALYQWSIERPNDFWQSLWDFFGIRSDTPTGPALAEDCLPGAVWWPTASINYARHALIDSWDGADSAGLDETAITAYSQTRDRIDLTWYELRDQVARAANGLRQLGVRRGDRVAAYLPNIPEATVAYLACASIGAIWSSVAPEFGSRSVVDRFSQVDPSVLLVVPGYVYGDKPVDRHHEVTEIRAGLPTVRHVVNVPYLGDPIPDSIEWSSLLEEPAELTFEMVPFDHPLCVLFSSGTTGKPKAIPHSQGSLIIEHSKNHALCWDLGPGDRLMWFSTTAWMMWNALISTLLLRASIVQVDGNPVWPDISWQWRIAAESQSTVMGASPGWLMACRKEGAEPTKTHDLSRIRHMPVAGAPLVPEGFTWVYEQFGEDLLLNVTSGGTDICSGMVGGSPLLPVYAGEMSGRLLGVATDAYDPAGRPVVGELGELVITQPLPSMPKAFWGPDGARRFHESYFDMFPGVWRQGDWIRFEESGSCVITGRSDATLNRGGVRLGTSDFYSVVEELPEISQSLVVHLEDPQGGNGTLILYVVLRDGIEEDGGVADAIRSEIRRSLSPRHVPDEVVVVPAIPTSRTGKRLELPVKRILQGADPESVASRDAIVDPHSLDAYIEHARRRQSP